MLKWTLEGRKWFLYRAKIPNVIASAFLIKREGKKDIFPDVGEKQYLQLQVQLGCCFRKGWKVKSDTVSTSPKWRQIRVKFQKKPSSFESFVQLP